MIPHAPQPGDEDGRPPKRWALRDATGLLVAGILVAIYFNLRRQPSPAVLQSR